MPPVADNARLSEVLEQAAGIAHETGQPLGSVHALLALFTLPTSAEWLLLERRVNEETILACMGQVEPEPPGVFDRLVAAATAAATARGEAPTDLDLLAACAEEPGSFAYRLLSRAGLDLVQLESAAARTAKEGLPQRLIELRDALRLPDEVPQRDTVEMPSLSADTVEVSSSAHRPSIQTPALPSASASPSVAPHRRAGERRRQRRGRRHSDRVEPASPQPDGSAAPTSAAPEDPEDQPSPFVLHRENFPWLTRLGRNLSHLACLDLLDPVIGRDREIDQVVDVLNKRRSNNPCLVGEPGVGKTAVAEGVASRLAAEHGDRAAPPERVIIQLDAGAILAGTHLRGSLAERLRGLQDEVRRAQGRVVVFIDEIHALLGDSGADGGSDAANELKTALARGEFPCIGATTVDEYGRHIETDPALDRRFTSVYVSEPDAEATLHIVRGLVEHYAAHHGVPYEDEAVRAAATLSRRYIHDRHDPDRTLSVLDLAGAIARRSGTAVDRRAVAEVIARTARVPVDHLLLDDTQRYLQMERHLAERIVGQRHALTAIAETIRRNLAGFAGGRPIGSLLLLGPTGVGKTEAAKALAAFLFGDREAMVRFDMSEYLESHSLARLIGAPPGYVGHEEGGQLTDAIRRRPYQVVLLDEIEKAHRDVWNLLLQLLDDGRVTDGRGRTVNFSNTVVVMTSNLGADGPRGGRRIGFADEGEAGEAHTRRVIERARAAFPPELWNRIERKLVFHPLSRAEICQIARLLLSERSALLERERGIRFEVRDAVVDLLVERGGFDPALGARPMRQTIGREVESRLADLILAGEVTSGSTVSLDVRDGELVISPAEPAPR